MCGCVLLGVLCCVCVCGVFYAYGCVSALPSSVGPSLPPPPPPDIPLRQTPLRWTPEKPRRSLWVFRGSGPRPQVHEKTPPRGKKKSEHGAGGKKTRNLGPSSPTLRAPNFFWVRAPPLVAPTPLGPTLASTTSSRADMHQVCSGYVSARNTTYNNVSTQSLKGFMWVTFAPTSGRVMSHATLFETGPRTLAQTRVKSLGHSTRSSRSFTSPSSLMFSDVPTAPIFDRVTHTNFLPIISPPLLARPLPTLCSTLFPCSLLVSLSEQWSLSMEYINWKPKYSPDFLASDAF